MKSIAYIVPYFGAFPNLFAVWLNSCKFNPTIDWLIFTDDHREFDYPENVHVHYTTLSELKTHFQKHFEYDIWLEKPYKLCDFKIAYGDLFQEYIKDYDYWGFCDIDLIWGDIRHFLTEEVLGKYDKVGFHGHSTLVKNNGFYKSFYKKGLKNGCSFKDIATSPDNCIADEDYFNKLFVENNIPFFQEVYYANLSTLFPNFRLTHLDSTEKKKNRKMIFRFNSGHLIRIALDSGTIYEDEFMYIHFLKRKMEVFISPDDSSYLIVPNKIIPNQKVDVMFIKSANSSLMIVFLLKRFYRNAYKLKWNTAIPIIYKRIAGIYRSFFYKQKKY